MEIPKDKLPLRISNKKIMGHNIILSSDSNRDPDKFPMALKCRGMMVCEDLSRYVIKAANEFPEAIKVLGLVLEAFALDGEDYTDGEILDIIHPLVNDYLTKLEST